jgi:hypothetical protein
MTDSQKLQKELDELMNNFRNVKSENTVKNESEKTLTKNFTYKNSTRF